MIGLKIALTAAVVSFLCFLLIKAIGDYPGHIAAAVLLGGAFGGGAIAIVSLLWLIWS